MPSVGPPWAGARGWGRRPSGVLVPNREALGRLSVSHWYPCGAILGGAEITRAGLSFPGVGSSANVTAASDPVHGLVYRTNQTSTGYLKSTSTSPPSSGTVTMWLCPEDAYNAGTQRGMCGWTPGFDGSPSMTMQLFSNNFFYCGWLRTADDDRVVLAATAALWPQNQWAYYALTWVDGGSTIFYVNGVQVGSQAGTTTGGTSDAMRWGTRGDSSTFNASFLGKIGDRTIHDRALAPAEIWSLYGPKRWDLYWEPSLRTYVFVGSGAGAALVASVGGAASASGALTTSITMAGALSAVGACAAALTTAIALVGALGGICATSGDITTAIRCEASAGGVASAAGDLTTAIPLVASADGSGAASADLSTAIRFASSVGGVGAATANLSVGNALDASVSGAGAAAGDLTTAIPLASSISGVASASSDLTTAIRLAAATSGVGTAAADLSTAIRLASATTATASTTGDLTTTVLLPPSIIEATVAITELERTVSITEAVRTITYEG